MKFKTFRILVTLGILGGIGWGVSKLHHSDPPHEQQAAMAQPDPAPMPAPAYVPPPPTPSPAAPVYAAPTPAPAPAAASAAEAPAAPASTLFIATLRGSLEDWLTSNGDRHGLMKQQVIIANAPYQITALRFKEGDAEKFSNDPSQWSQFRIDFDRDGITDEKWLLKNGHTYKREVLDGNGKTTATQYFDK